MADGTKIEWADATFNPWLGCTKISSACDHCYAEAWARRTGNAALWEGTRRITSAANWRLPLKWNRAAQHAGVRRRVFCASLADVFDNQVPDEWRRMLWALIDSCRSLDWLLLTKRPQNINKMLPSNWGNGWPHVWLGAKTENQAEADLRIPDLFATPAAVRFILADPLLGPVDLSCLQPADGCQWHALLGSRWQPGVGSENSRTFRTATLDWVIVGGERGPGARPFNAEWARLLIQQCRSAGVACFVKQLGSNAWFGSRQYGPASDRYIKDKKGGDWSEWPEDLRVREFPA